jgi:quercetin dioxygenase-like cupin family protein
MRGEHEMSTKRHVFVRGAEANPATPEGFEGHSSGFTRWSIVDHAGPAVHTGFGINTLAGSIDTHVHSFEESFFVTAGAVICHTPEASVRLEPGDYGVIPVGVPHAWETEEGATCQWADMFAPQPSPGFLTDTFFVDRIAGRDPVAVDPRDPRTRSFGHIEPANMDPTRQSQDLLKVSASMRTALLVYSGITVKMMVDSDLGAHLQTMFMVQYQPGGVAGAHDHPLEETYYILEGETVARFDGEEFLMRPGDVAFAGVGCVHEFSNPGPGIVRWLETQAPQPPARHSYRFARDWTYLRDALEVGDE